MFDLTGCTAVLTGASGAIGQAIHERLAESGATVIGADLKPNGEISELDVAAEESWQSFVQTVRSRVEAVDILVNCAGIAPMGKLEDFQLSEWRRTMSVNVEGVALGIREFLPLLKAAQGRRAGGASIINIASAASRRPSAMSAAYCSSKAAVGMLTKVAAVEFATLGYKIRVNSVHPGVVESPMMNDILATYSANTGVSSAELREGILGQYLVKRFADPNEIAMSVLYLASDEAAYLNGTEQHVDGGYLTT